MAPKRSPGQLLRILFTTLVLVAPGSLGAAQAAERWELWKISPDGTGLALFTDTPGYTCGSPDWSPDGNLLVYDTWQVGQPLQASQIAVVRADGTHRRLLGPGAMPSWSPDGTQIVCHTYNPDTIIVMNADGTGREKILDHWGSPRWAPRGNRIASILNGDIALYDLTTGREHGILGGRYNARQGFAISPDGLHICFGDYNSISTAVATLNEVTGEASVNRLPGSGTCHCASWAPDGKRIVLGWEPTGTKLAQLYIFDADGKSAPKRIAGQDKNRNAYNPDWSPDGKTIVFASEAEKP